MIDFPPYFDLESPKPASRKARAAINRIANGSASKQVFASLLNAERGFTKTILHGTPAAKAPIFGRKKYYLDALAAFSARDAKTVKKLAFVQAVLEELRIPFAPLNDDFRKAVDETYLGARNDARTSLGPTRRMNPQKMPAATPVRGQKPA